MAGVRGEAARTGTGARIGGNGARVRPSPAAPSGRRLGAGIAARRARGRQRCVGMATPTVTDQVIGLPPPQSTH